MRECDRYGKVKNNYTSEELLFFYFGTEEARRGEGRGEKGRRLDGRTFWFFVRRYGWLLIVIGIKENGTCIL